MEEDMQGNQLENKTLRKEIRSVSTELKSYLATLVYTVLLQRINMVVRSRKKAINLRHQEN